MNLTYLRFNTSLIKEIKTQHLKSFQKLQLLSIINFSYLYRKGNSQGVKWQLINIIKVDQFKETN
jgi:hypothetical protein